LYIGRFRNCNNAFCELFDANQAELRARPLEMFADANDRTRVREAVGRMINGLMAIWQADLAVRTYAQATSSPGCWIDCMHRVYLS
jgi:hypothetical protein